MKKLSMILTSCLLVLGLARCTKDKPEEQQKVLVTFQALDGAKTNIDDMGRVTYNNGDQLHVYASSTGYLGALTTSDGGANPTFSGEITQWTEGETLRFFYLGTANTPNTDGTVTINFADQSYVGTQSKANDLANIAAKFHVSRYEQSSVAATITTFSGTMRNMMAIGLFNTSAFTDAATNNVKMYAATGLKNRLSISPTGVLTYDACGVGSQENQSGWIVTGPASSARFIALLPEDETTPANAALTFTSQGYKSSSAITKTIAANSYLRGVGNTAISVSAQAVTSDYVDLAVPTNAGIFTVDSDGKKVKFAKGNLVYDQGRFKMLASQIGWPASGNVTANMAVNGTFEHFGWGTSGIPSNDANLTMPQAYTLPSTGYYYGTPRIILIGGNAIISAGLDIATNFDWGVYQFGMNTGASWRTLSSSEWLWLLGPDQASITPGTDCRNTVTRFLKAQLLLSLAGYPAFRNGLILFPDNFDATLLNGNYSTELNSYNTSFQTVSESLWNDLEGAGCVFLPVEGFRTPDANNLASSAFVNNVGTTGYYWTATAKGDGEAYLLGFTDNEMEYYSNNRYVGCSVRLVQDVQ